MDLSFVQAITMNSDLGKSDVYVKLQSATLPQQEKLSIQHHRSNIKHEHNMHDYTPYTEPHEGVENLVQAHQQQFNFQRIRSVEAERVAKRRASETREQRDARLARGREYMRRKRAKAKLEIRMGIVEHPAQEIVIEQSEHEISSPVIVADSPETPPPAVQFLSVQSTSEPELTQENIASTSQQEPRSLSLTPLYSPLIPTMAPNNSVVVSLSSTSRFIGEAPEHRMKRLERQREYMRRKREMQYATESDEQREKRLQANRERSRRRRANETPSQREKRLEQQRTYSQLVRSNRHIITELPSPETPEDFDAHKKSKKRFQSAYRRLTETPEQRNARLEYLKEYQRHKLSAESPEDREKRLASMRAYQKHRKAIESQGTQYVPKRIAYSHNLYSPYDIHERELSAAEAQHLDIETIFKSAQPEFSFSEQDDDVPNYTSSLDALGALIGSADRVTPQVSQLDLQAFEVMMAVQPSSSSSLLR